MASGDVMSGDKVKIYIGDAGAIGSDLTSADEYQAEITSFNANGGEIDYDSEAVFGGFIDLKKPQSQYEVSMDVLLRFSDTPSDMLKWDTLKSSGTAKMIGIEVTDGTLYYWNAFNNVRVVNFDKEFEAEGEWRGTMTFKLSPTDADGNKNTQEGATSSLATELTSWS